MPEVGCYYFVIMCFVNAGGKVTSKLAVESPKVNCSSRREEFAARKTQGRGREL